jgi:hypothetical protein
MGLRHGLFAGFSLVVVAASASAQTPPVFAGSLAPETIDVTAGGTGITNEGGSSPDLGPAHEGGPGVRSSRCA